MRILPLWRSELPARRRVYASRISSTNGSQGWLRYASGRVQSEEFRGKPRYLNNCQRVPYPIGTRRAYDFGKDLARFSVSTWRDVARQRRELCAFLGSGHIGRYLPFR